MMGRKHREQANLFYEFRLDDMIPKGQLLRRINVFVTSVLSDLREQLGPFYSDIGRPSIDPELLTRMLIIGYCFGIRSERKLCEGVRLHLAYRWFWRLDLNDAVPHHSTFSENHPGQAMATIHSQTTMFMIWEPKRAFPPAHLRDVIMTSLTAMLSAMAELLLPHPQPV